MGVCNWVFATRFCGAIVVCDIDATQLLRRIERPKLEAERALMEVAAPMLVASIAEGRRCSKVAIDALLFEAAAATHTSCAVLLLVGR